METDLNDEKLDRLFAAARKSDPYVSVEYGFETRLMAKIHTRRALTVPFFIWSWRLIPAFVFVVFMLGIWAYESEQGGITDLSSLAGIGNEETMLVASLTGE